MDLCQEGSESSSTKNEDANIAETANLQNLM